MGYIVLSCLVIVCAAGWLLNRLSAATLLWYLQEKNCPFPSDEEMRKGSRFVLEHMIKDFLKGKN